MANNENLKNIELSHEEAARNGKKGGIASGESRRLNKRLANLTKHTNRLSLTKHKRMFRKLWKVKKGYASKDGKLVTEEDVKEEIRDIIENMRIIKDCGSDVLNIVAIANSPYLAISKPEVVIKAQAELWDRREGKSIQSIFTTGSEVRKTIVLTEKELEEEEKSMLKEFEDEE